LQTFEDEIVDKIKEIKQSKNYENILIALHSFLSDNLDSPSVTVENIKTFEELHHELYFKSLDEIRLDRLKLLNKYIDSQYLYSLPINKINKALDILDSFLGFTIFYDTRRADFFAECSLIETFSSLDLPEKFKQIIKEREEFALSTRDKILNITKNTNKYNCNTIFYETVITKSLKNWQKTYGHSLYYILNDTEKRMKSLILK